MDTLRLLALATLFGSNCDCMAGGAAAGAATEKRIAVSQFKNKSLETYLSKERLSKTPKWEAGKPIPLNIDAATKVAVDAVAKKFPLEADSKWRMRACCLFEYTEGHLYQFWFYESQVTGLGDTPEPVANHVAVTVLLDGSVLLPEPER